MQTVIIIIHLMVVLAMTGLVLLQKSEGGGLGMGGGGGFLSTRGTSNMLTRSTAILAAVFFVTSLALSIIAGMERKPRSIMNTPAGPAVPLGSGRSSTPVPAPAPPPGPQAPGPQSPPAQ